MRFLMASLFWFALRGEGQPMPDLAKLGWHAVTEPALRLGQIGALGGQLGGQLGGERPPADLASMKSYEALALLRAGGAATFATSAHAGLPFDLGAARLIDALVVTDGPDPALALWSFLLDHGYAVAPIAGSGRQLYVNCPQPTCVADAVRISEPSSPLGRC